MAPILPGLSDRPELLADVVRAARDAGATSIWTERALPAAGHPRALPRESRARLAGAAAALRAALRGPGVPRRRRRRAGPARGRRARASGSRSATDAGSGSCRRRRRASRSSSTSPRSASALLAAVGAAAAIGLTSGAAGRLGYPEHDGPPALPQDPARRAPLPSRRRGDAGDHVEHRPRPGDQAPDPRLLGVPRHDHGVREAEPQLRRLPPALPLDRADPELADRGRAGGLRGRRRRVPQEQRHDDRAPLQPDEAEPRRRAGPRPHHRRGGAGHGPGEPRVPGQAGPDLLPRPGVPVRAERDHRREGDRLARPGRRRDRHRRPRIGDLPRRRLPPPLPPGPPVRARADGPHRRGRARSTRSPGSSSCSSPTGSATASRRPTTRGRWR